MVAVKLRFLPDGTRNPEMSDIEFYESETVDTQMRLDQLWQSATRYQEQFISNAAYGLLAIGVIQQKPKSIACMQWIQSIWTAYYEQKPLVTHEYTGFDFSAVGAMPYTVPELTAEVLGA